MLFQGGEAVLSPQDPFLGAELAGIKCSDLRGFSVTHHLIIPQLLPAAVCLGEFTAISLPLPHPIPHSRFCCCHPCPKWDPQAPGSSCQAARGRADGTQEERRALPCPAQRENGAKGAQHTGGTSRPVPALPAAVPVLLSPLAPGSEALWPLSLRVTGPRVAPGVTLGRSSRTRPFLPRLALPGETDNAAGSTRALQGRLGRS